jgi:hypothetical protein
VRQIAHAAENLHIVVKSIGHMCKHFALNALLRQHVVQVSIEHGVAVCAAIACAAAAFHNTHCTKNQKEKKKKKKRKVGRVFKMGYLFFFFMRSQTC